MALPHINAGGSIINSTSVQAYETKLDVDFTPLREQDMTAAGLGRAA